MKSFFISLSLLITVSVKAESIKLAAITSEFDKNVTDFYIETDDQNKIHTMRYITILPNGGIDEDISLPAETVVREGAVIVVRHGREAVRIFVENFSLRTGGIIKLNYLHSGVTNNWQVKRLKVVLVENHFRLEDLENVRTNKLYMRINWSRIFGAVGIRDIQTMFSPEI